MKLRRSPLSSLYALLPFRTPSPACVLLSKRIYFLRNVFLLQDIHFQVFTPSAGICNVNGDPTAQSLQTGRDVGTPLGKSFLENLPKVPKTINVGGLQSPTLMVLGTVFLLGKDPKWAQPQ